MQMTITKDEFNGMGSRITRMEIGMGEQKERTTRNAGDIQKIFESMAHLPFWIIGSMLLPSLLIIYQIATK